MEKIKNPLSSEKYQQQDLPFSKKYFNEILYLGGDSSRDGTMKQQSTLLQNKEGKWILDGEEVRPDYVLLIASRELPSNVLLKLKEEIEEIKEESRKKPI